jgi:hypothetical protein
VLIQVIAIRSAPVASVPAVTSRVFRPDERPDVQVRIDGVWYPGELRMWQRRKDGWWANVTWRTGPGLTFVGSVPQDDVRREDRELDR